MDFPGLLEKVQVFLSENYKDLMVEGGSKNPQQTKAYIRQYITDNDLSVSGFTTDQLVNQLYRETAEYSFLTPYLDFTIKGVENIEICSPDNIWIKYSDGTEKQSEEHFLDAKHAKDVMIRLLHQSGISMENSRPLVRGHYGKRIRITVNGGGGTLDEDVGISASIRFINPNGLTSEDLIQNGTLTAEMMDFLIAAYRYGQSMVLSGETDAGKTTLIAAIMSSAVPNDKKLYTIEYETREFDLVKRNKEGKPINKVVSTVTRWSDDPKLMITPQMLLEHGMTMNPDFICMAEIKGSEAFETIEAGETGHPVIATTHADTAEDIPNRLVPLASMKGNNLSEKTLYYLVARAFPILFHSQKMEDKKRRVTEICECTYEDGHIKVIPLWVYKIEFNEVVDGKTIIHGHFEKQNIISEHLQQRLRSKSIPESLLQSFLKKEG
jgi:pilus assembly protein CpaF